MGLREGYRAFNTALDLLYKNETLNLADKKPFKFKDKVFMDAAQKVYDEGGFDLPLMNTPEAKAVIAETARILSEAISNGIPHEVPATLRYALENNAFIFSGFKTFHSLREVGLSMVTEKGSVKPFEEFLVDVKKVNEKYNQNYLYAEYNHAVGTSLMAVKWNDFTQDGDRYNLQYRTAGDDRVREEHAALHGITLPINDPFWDKYFPPNGWNCRCTAVQVRKNKYPTSDPAKAMEAGDNCTSGIKREMFRYNPGKTMELFPPKHPYKKVPKAAKKVVEKVTEEISEATRVEQIIAELPDTLTAEEKKAVAEHCLKLETAYGLKKGSVMSYEQANNGKENPDFNKGGGYTVNCQTCTVTHWLRRLGFDVNAKPNVRNSAYKEMQKQGISWLQRFTNLDGSDVDYDFAHKWQWRKGYKSMTPKRLMEYFKEKFDHDGVYEIYCAWKGGSAHVFCAEVTNGKARLFDPQSGEHDVRRYINRMKPGSVGVVRIDNKLVNEKLKNLFVSK